jgi:hypothetical protein
MSTPLGPAAPQFRGLIDWLETPDVPNPPHPPLDHRPRVAAASVQFIGGPIGTENFSVKGAWIGVVRLRLAGGPLHRLLVGTLRDEPGLPISGPLEFAIRVGREDQSPLFFAGVSNPQLDAKWSEAAFVIINAPPDPLSQIVVGSIEDRADDFGDQFLFCLGPNRTLR